MGHPVLKEPAAEIGDIRAPEIHVLVRDMIETLADAGGIGLAAPQVHESLRLMVFYAPREVDLPDDASPDDEDPDDEDPGDVEEDPDVVEENRERAAAERRILEREGMFDHPPLVLLNPEIEFLTEEVSESWEACLSIPGLRGKVPRCTHIRYRGTDLKGETVEVEAKDFHARIFQHEFDHLDGILYPQRMTDLGSLMFEREG